MSLRAYLLCVLTLIAFNLSARSPAVEPLMGSSIEEYKEVDPKKAKGYNFNRTPSSLENQIPRKHNETTLKTKSATDTKENLDFLVLFFILLPVFVSAIAYFKFKSGQETTQEIVENNSQSNSEDHDFPKAS